MTGRYRWIPLTLLIAHAVALVFGLVGILIMLPNPDLWADDPNAVRIFDWSMEHAGAAHIILGSAAVFAFGVLAIGWFKTTVFAVVAFTLSLSSELIGTGTGWPFGNYEYTAFLGYKVLDQVPYTIPLSWFYVGFVSFLLGGALVDRFGLGNRAIWMVAIGTWFLTVWDLVLDPAMAHESSRIKFWVWDEAGPYFGMPIKNFIGWSLTGLLFMAISRLIWREDVDTRKVSMQIPFAVYALNIVFAMVLSLAVDLWIPVLLALVLGLLPAALAIVPQRRDMRAMKQLQLSQDA